MPISTRKYVFYFLQHRIHVKSLKCIFVFESFCCGLQDPRCRTALHFLLEFASDDSVPAVMRALLDAGANILPDDLGRTPLHWVASKYVRDCLKFL